MKEEIKNILHGAHLLRERIGADTLRPAYHFRVPYDLGFPADPNAIFYASGKYHMMFLYEHVDDSYRWGHAVSADLLHWTFCRDCLIPDKTDGGIYSGGVYLDENGRAIVAYWALGKDGSAGGIRIAVSEGPRYENWTKSDGYAVKSSQHGIFETGDPAKPYAGCADPSNIFRLGDKYAMLLGNLCLLDKFRDQNAPQYKGDWAELFLSEDLKNWRYDGRFYQRVEGWTQPSEDCMCPYFAPIYGLNGEDFKTHILLFISHTQGCQYYTGKLDEKAGRFIPQNHGRFAAADNALFACEAVLTPEKKTVLFCWMRDNLDDDLERERSKGWSGVYCLPRELYVEKDGRVQTRPWDKVRELRCNRQSFTVGAGEEILLTEPMHCELVIEPEKGYCGEFGIRVEAEGKQVRIGADFSRGSLVFDTTKAGLGRTVCEETPMAGTGENVLDVFIDGCIADVFCNGAALTRQFFLPEKRKLSVYAEKAAKFTITAYEIMPTNIF